MSKTLREIAPNRSVAMRAPDIASVMMIHKVAYVYDQRGDILFLMPCDALLGYTGGTVTVRQGSHALTYNNMGSQTLIQTIR
jgi:hypothetical protein